MTPAEPDDFDRHAVDAIARLILQDALDDLSLVRRTRGSADLLRENKAQPPVVRQPCRSPLTLASDPELARKRYLEDLFSIAVAAAERADNILMKANAAHAKAVRTIGALAVMATVGMSVGILGMVASVRSHPGQFQSLEQPQQPAKHQLAAVKSVVTDERQASTTTQQTAPDPQQAAKQQVIIVPGGRPIIATPLPPLYEATYSAPWPEPVDKGQSTSYATWPQSADASQAASHSSLWPSRPHHAHPTSAPPRHVQTPGFFAAIQRGLRTLFR